MILHISDDNVFLDSAIDHIEKIAPGTNKYIVTDRNPQKIKNSDKIIVDPNSIQYRECLENLEEYDAVILHALTKDKVEIVNNASEKVRFVWMFWGADGYELPGMRKYLFTSATKKILSEIAPRINLKKKFSRLLKSILSPLFIIFYKNRDGIPYYFRLKKAIKRINFISPVVEEDFYRLKKYVKTRAEFLPFSYGSLESRIKIILKSNVNYSDILVGNSANPSNNHIDIFKILKDIRIDHGKIIVPLSYGDVYNYRDKIIVKGKEYFMDRFEPILDFLEFEKFTKIISECKAIILNHIRQQAAGMIMTALWYGKKVFMNKRSTLFQFYKKRNAIIFSNDEITEDSLFSPLSESEVNENRQVLEDYYSEEKVMQRTENFIKKLTIQSGQNLKYF